MKKTFILLVAFMAIYSIPAYASELDQIRIGEQPDLLADEFDESDDYDSDSIYDPLEAVNRVFFEFNDKLYFWVIKPVKTSYSFIIPEELRQCISNFFANLASPIHLVNNLLQGRFEDAGIVLSRFVINTTLGVYGFGDVALAEFDIKPQIADFGQTLGFYGVGEGIYVCWPVVGPSNLRDSVGLVGDTLMSPVFHADITTGESLMIYSTNMINFMSLGPDVYENMKKHSLDPYITARQAFYDFRRNIIKKASDDEMDF
jgi:phospholipid-binding lipoprotein MlaA